MDISPSGSGHQDDQPSRRTSASASSQFDDQPSAGPPGDAGDGGVGAGPWSRTMPFGAIVPAGARLRVEEASVDQPEIRLDGPSLRIGRRAGNDVVIHDTNVSRQHARIVRQGDCYVIEDTDSANGTRVNGQVIVNSRELRDGDRIEIGDARFVFELEPRGRVDLDDAYPHPNDASDWPGEGGTVHGFAPPADQLPSAEPNALPERQWTDQPGSAATSDPVPFPDDQMVDPHSIMDSFASADVVDAHAGSRMDGMRRELGELRREVAEARARLDGVLERADALESSVDDAAPDLDRLNRVTQGAGRASLLQALAVLEEVASSTYADRLSALQDVLGQLGEHPRDVDLLRQVSEHSDLLREVVERHARLAVVAPMLHAAVGDVLG